MSLDFLVAIAHKCPCRENQRTETTPYPPEKPGSDETNASTRSQVYIQSPYYYMVKISIGTFKPKPPNPTYKSYYLYMDTNSYGDSSNQIAGVMGLGLGWGSSSLLTQAYPTTQGTFSYCLPLINKYTQKWPTTFLRFGTDIIKSPNSTSTPLFQIKNHTPYHLILQGITPTVSANHGCIIDSGTPFSRLIRPSYLDLERALRRHFSGHLDMKPYRKGPKGFDLCYERRQPQGFKNLPRITLHLH